MQHMHLRSAIPLAPLFAAALLTPSVAHADATLTSVSGAPGLAEADHRLSIEVDGVIAVVRSHQSIVNHGDGTRELLYTFDLPGDATVIDLRVLLADGRAARTAVVASTAALQLAPESAATEGAPDVAVLRLVRSEEPDPARARPPLSTYELRVYPVAPGQAVAVDIAWIAPLRYDDGRLSLRVPGRGLADNLLRERVELSLRAPVGARALGAVHAGGKQLAARAGTRARYELTAPADGDFVVELAPELAGRRAPPALLGFGTHRLGKDWGVVAVSALAPIPPPDELPHYDRIIVVVDVSRSMGRDGLIAASSLARAVLGAADPSARVELITFDRTARRVFDELRPNDGATRTAVGEHLLVAPLANGSDLGAGLDRVREVFARLPELPHRPPTPANLVVVITDGVTPLDLTADDALHRAGTRALAEAEFLVVTLVPDDVPMPDTTAGPLGALARWTGGRSIAVRVGEAGARAGTLAAEMSLPPPLELAELVAPRGTELSGLALPSALEVGRGAFAVGVYRGREPRALRMTGTLRGKEVSLTAARQPVLARAALPLWLATASPVDFIAPAARPAGHDHDLADDLDRYDGETATEARRGMLVAARAANAVTAHTSLVALDPRGVLGRDRIAFADKYGALFFRMPPPPERAPDHAFRPHEHIPAGAAPTATRAHTGELDQDIVIRLLRTFVLPKAYACYTQELRRDRKLHGTMHVVVEIARGEVQAARIEKSTLKGAAIDACVIDAAYSIQVPRVALGADPETISIARYPITFRVVNARGEVIYGAPRGDDDEIDADDPLGGI